MFTLDNILFLIEIIGTVAFAVSGAMVAIRRGLDLFGVLFLGGVTAIGGGVVRDLLLGQTPPQAFADYIYLLTAVVTSVLVFGAVYLSDRWDRVLIDTSSPFFNFCDAAGLGIFSVIGVQNTVAAGFGDNGFFCVFLGMTTGVGGGMLRDVLSRSTPLVLRKHIYALASIAGAALYYYLSSLLPTGSIFISTALVITLRMLASRYKWALPHVPPSAAQSDKGKNG